MPAAPLAWCSCGWVYPFADLLDLRVEASRVVQALVDDHWALGHEVRASRERGAFQVIERAALGLAARRRGVR